MNSPTDPYTRSPMTEEDLVPQPELKEKIMQYKHEKRSQYQAEKDRRYELPPDEESKEN